MSQIRLYLYSNCSSCKNAQQVLEERGVAFQARDLFRDKLSASELRALLTEIGRSPVEMLSRRSIPYRQMRLADVHLGDEEILDRMAEFPALIRRPILVAPGHALVGFNRTELEKVAQANGRQ